MARAKVKISAKSGRSGTKIASSKVRVTRSGNGRGKRLFQTKAQLTVRVDATQNGQSRQKNRS